jgi:LysM repeat protein
MTRQQAIFIIALNAGVSLVISLLVVWLVRPPRAPEEALAHTAPSGMPSAKAAPQTSAPGEPGAAAAPTPVIHKVRTGETLLWIAMKYDVSSERIIEANNLVDPDVLVVDQELVIPTPLAESVIEVDPTAEAKSEAETAPRVATATAPPSPAKASPSPTPTATQAGEYRLEITQIVAPGRQEAEVLVVTNYGRDVRLQGWTLSNGRGQVYAFPNLTLFRGNSVRIYTSKGRNTPSDLYWGLDSAAWGPEVDAAVLKDPDGEVQAIRDLR